MGRCTCRRDITEIQLKMALTLPKQQVLDSSKLKEFSDGNFKFNENGRKFSKRVENTMGKGEIARYEQFLLFPYVVVSKDLYCRQVENRVCCGKS